MKSLKWIGLVLSGMIVVGGAGALWLVSHPGGDSVIVYFPKGSCETGLLEVQTGSAHEGCEGSLTGAADPKEACFEGHRYFPKIEAEQCFREYRGIASNSLRVRCVDPKGVMQPSNWVGPAVTSDLKSGTTCKKMLSSPRQMADRLIHLLTDETSVSAAAPVRK